MTLQRAAEAMPTVVGTAAYAGADQVMALTEQVNQLLASNEHLSESIRDLEMDDIGWTRFTAQVEQEFTATGRQRIVEVCRMMAISNPLLKRGLTVRAGYVWGQGVEVTARVPGPDGKADTELQDAVNQVIDQFERTNAKSYTGMLACEELERALGTDGEIFLALFSNPMTGVRVRSVPQLQIQQIVTNPEDDDEPWFYVREYVVAGLPKADQPLEAPPTTLKRVIYPALGFDPGRAGLGFKPRVLNGIEVLWDAPMVHVPVNRLDGWQRGIPDVYASVAWARLYQDFLIDWSGLTKALSKIAFRATGATKGRAQQAAAAVKAQQPTPSTSLPGPNTQTAGGTVVTGPGAGFEAVSKSGATIDSESGRPLASMVAAGIGLPVTTLLADPGVTGARAVAETLDTPIILEMGMRRLLHQFIREQILRHVIATEAMRPGSPLRGLGEDQEPALDFSWPPLAKLDPLQLVQAVVTADSTEKMPPLTTVRLLLQALGVPNVDEVLAEVTDEDGNFIDPGQAARASVGQAAVDAARRGEDPAGVVR